MINFKKCTMEEFWQFIATHLESHDIEVTLVGGGVATIYSHGKYMSGDLDFVFGWQNNHKEIREALAQIGFTAKTRIFSHPDCPYTLDFSSPPVDIGNKNDPEIEERKVSGQVIRILTPTECIKDRLHKAHHWKDEQAMQAAIAVAQTQSFSIEKVKAFCGLNGMMKTFEDFRNKIQK